MGSNPAESGSWANLLYYYYYIVITKLCQLAICSMSESTLNLLLKNKNKVEEYIGVPEDQCASHFKKSTFPTTNPSLYGRGRNAYTVPTDLGMN